METTKNFNRWISITLLCQIHINRKKGGIVIFIDHKIPNFEILDRCRIFSVQSLLDKNKLRWTGHVIRMVEARIPKILLYGRVDKAAAKKVIIVLILTVSRHSYESTKLTLQHLRSRPRTGMLGAPQSTI